MFYDDVSYSLDVRYFMAWFGLLHPPSIFTLFTSPVEVLRPRRRLSLRMLFLSLHSTGLIPYLREIVLLILYH